MTSPEGMPAGEALGRLVSSVTLTPYEAGSYDAGRRFERIVRFATVDCVKAGWMVKAKGVWSVTQTGEHAYQTFAEPDAFYRQATRLYRAWKASQTDEVLPPTTSPGLSEIAVAEGGGANSAGVTFEEAEEQAWSEIEQFLGAMSPFDFQELFAALLRAMDYHVLWISPPGRDGGVDIIATLDPLGTKPPRIKVQVKRVAHRTDIDVLKSFVAVLDEEDVGIFLSAGGFTRPAEEFARAQSRRRVTLLDLKRLVELWIEFYAKLDALAQRRLPLSPIYFLKPQN